MNNAYGLLLYQSICIESSLRKYPYKSVKAATDIEGIIAENCGCAKPNSAVKLNKQFVNLGG